MFLKPGQIVYITNSWQAEEYVVLRIHAHSVKIEALEPPRIHYWIDIWELWIDDDPGYTRRRLSRIDLPVGQLFVQGIDISSQVI